MQVKRLVDLLCVHMIMRQEPTWLPPVVNLSGGVVHSMSCWADDAVLWLTKNASPSSGGQQHAMGIRDVCPQCQSPQFKKTGTFTTANKIITATTVVGSSSGASRNTSSRRISVRSSNACCWNGFRYVARKTNHIKRFNNTLRQRVSRLVRETLSFAKKLANHIGAIKLFICHYNLTRTAA